MNTGMDMDIPIDTEMDVEKYLDTGRDTLVLL
jgi:hypothetical protein